MTAAPQPSQPVIPPDLPSLVFPEPKKRNNTVWIVLGAFFATLCLVVVVCLVLGGLAVGRTIIERQPIQNVLDQFMQDMAARDIDSAFSLFSPRAQRQIPRSKLAGMIEGNNYVLFKGYEGLIIQNLNISAVVNTNPDVPQGTVANVTGTINYSDGFEGKFQAVLEKVDTEWRLDFINITVPPNKIQGNDSVGSLLQE